MTAAKQVSAASAINEAQTRASALLPPEDEAALGWFFGKGLAAFERSTFGAMIERLAMDAHTSRSCFTCRGTGVAGSDGGPVWTEKRSKGEEKPSKGEEDVVWGAGNWCPKCRGVGCIPVRKTNQRHSVTVQITAEAHDGLGYVPNDAALTRFAVVSRRLGFVPLDLARALATYFGDVGSRWAPTGNGRLFALYPLTEAGKRLLRSTEDSESVDLLPHERLNVLVELDRLQAKGARRVLLDAAASQAIELFEAAAEAWTKAQVA